jgi:hypothetical protein
MPEVRPPMDLTFVVQIELGMAEAAARALAYAPVILNWNAPCYNIYFTRDHDCIRSESKRQQHVRSRWQAWRTCNTTQVLFVCYLLHSINFTTAISHNEIHN